MGLRERTIGVAPVGCSVFAYNYFDTDFVEAAHGRAPAMATGIKRVLPDRVVFTYQGDGDLASIGMAEIMSAAQLGLPITVIFVNNAIYGMTGGQMAPTTLMGQKTSTTPYGRDPYNGQPLKMAELIAQLDGPVYVERVALYDAKQRVRAEKAILKALKLQVEGRGFAFVEVLAECPTHLKMSAEDSEAWVRDTMTQVFPLGVKKDLVDAPSWYHPPKPAFDPTIVADAIGGSREESPRYCASFPSHVAPHDIALKFAGAGGDGAQTAALLIAQAGINEGFDATHIPSYGPESRGGTSYADVHIAAEEVASPSSPRPHILVAFNAPSLAKFAPFVRPGGTIVFDSSVIEQPPIPPDGVKMVGVPFTGIATELGKPVVKNVVALGAVQAATKLFPADTFLTALRQALRDKAKVIPLNEEAFAKGQAAV
jgi:2-oxoisovalerate ferredoxin oxidoreductase beta subunit